MNFRRCLWVILACYLVVIPVYASELDNKLNNLSKEIISNMTKNNTIINKNNKITIAVIEFPTIDGKNTLLGRSISEQLTTKLYLTKKFDIIERGLLDKVLAELKLNITGIIDSESAKQLGKILGVNAIVTGTITELDKAIQLNARLIATETGLVFGVAAVEMKKDEDIKKLLNQLTGEQKTNDNQTSLSDTQTINNFTEITTSIADENILYQTDFEDNNLMDWSSKNTVDLEQEENNWVLNCGSEKNCSASLECGFDWTDYILTTKIKSMKDSHAGFAISVRLNHETWTRYGIFFNEDGKVILDKESRPKAHNEVSKGFFSFRKDRWYTVTISIQHNNIQVMVDNKKLINYTDANNPLLNGSICLETSPNGHYHFDDVKITLQ